MKSFRIKLLDFIIPILHRKGDAVNTVKLCKNKRMLNTMLCPHRRDKRYMGQKSPLPVPDTALGIHGAGGSHLQPAVPHGSPHCGVDHYCLVQNLRLTVCSDLCSHSFINMTF